MTCRDRILSEEFQDFLTYYILPEGTLEEEVSGGAFCSVPVSGRLPLPGGAGRPFLFPAISTAM